MRRVSLLSSTLMFVFLSWSTAVAGPTIKVKPNKTRMSINEYLVLDIEFEVQGGGSDPTLKPPDLSDWERVRVESSGTQQSIRIINGSVSRSFSKRERWILKPLKVGRLPIGAFELVGSDGRTRSRVRHVRVRDDGQSSRRAQTTPRGQPPSGYQEQLENRPMDQRIFLRWQLQNRAPYVGEPLLVHLELVYDPRLRPTHSSGLDKLDFSGFWTKKVDQPEQREWAEDVGGYEFRVQRLISYRLVPLDTQERALPGVSMNVELSTIRRRSGSFLGRQTLVPWGEVAAKSTPVPLKIRALPKKGRPKFFPKTSVGQTSIRAKLSQRRVRADSGVDLIIETVTDGLMQNFPEIEPGDIPGFDVYPSQTTMSEDLRTRNRMGDQVAVRNVRRQTFLLRPKKVGRLGISSFELPYFNPKNGRYETARTRPLSVQVHGVVPKTKDGSGTDQVLEKVSKKRKALRPLSRTLSVTEDADWLGDIVVFYGVAIGIPGILIIGLLIRRRWSHLERTQGDRSAIKALKNARRALQRIKEDGSKGLKEKARRTKAVALEYLEQRTQQNLMGFAYDELVGELARLGADREDLARFVELLETLDYESFSGTLSGSTFDQQLTDIAQLLEKFEASLESV